MPKPTSALSKTVHVAVNGAVTRGGIVRHLAANIRDELGQRIIAAPPPKHGRQRFAPGGIPKGVDPLTTVAHDCANHLSDVAEAHALTDPYGLFNEEVEEEAA